MNYASLSSLLSNVWGVFLALFFLGASIFVHELGHFLAARRRGLKVERFSIGFGPRLFGWKGKDGVEYRVSLLPLGGYVALPQLADMRAIEGDSETPVEQLPPISYADKMIVSVAGAAFNLILAFALATVIWLVGVPSSEQEQTNRVGYVAPEIESLGEEPLPGPAFKAGIRPGDHILAVDGERVENFRDIAKAIATGSGRAADDRPRTVLTVEREGRTSEVEVFPALARINARSGDRLRLIGVSPAHSVIVSEVNPGSPAERAGLKPGDRILEVEGRKIYALANLTRFLSEHPDVKARLTVERDGRVMEVPIRPRRVPISKPLGVVSLPAEEENVPRPRLELLPVEHGVTGAGLPLRAPQGSAKLTNPAEPATLAVFNLPADHPLRSAGLRSGLILSSVGGQAPASLEDFARLTEPLLSRESGATLRFADPENPGEWVDVQVPMGSEVSVRPPEQRVVVGFVVGDNSQIVYPSPWRQFRESVHTTVQTLASLLNRNSDISIQHLSGPVGIVRIFHRFSLEDLRSVLWFTVLLNINLAVLNLLPIPVLDGGHMVFATIARLRGGALPQSVVAGAQGVFMVLLLGLMAYVLLFDSLRWIGDSEQAELERQMKLYYVRPVFDGAQPASE